MLKRLFCSVSLLIALSTPSLAWWNGGHQAVGLIAFHQLTAQQQQKLMQILGSHPGEESYKISFPNCCTWPDAIRGQADDRPTWHYKDLPFWDGVAQHRIGHQDEQNADFAIRANLEIMADEFSSNEQRARALSWLGHIIGDIHQPLHAAARCTPAHPDGDRGGNDFKVNLSNWNIKSGNLHKFWDSGALLLHPEPNPEQLERFVEETERLYPRSSFQAEQLRSDSSTWIEESFELAKQVVYPGVQEQSEPSPEYIQRSQPICRQRIALAGYRLGFMLRVILR